MVKRVAALSGGGVKGYAEAQVLKFNERQYGRLCDYYDLMCGSSVGAINASILATGRVSADELEKIYPSMIKRVFKGKKWYQFPKSPKYDRGNFREVWEEVIGSDFRLGDCVTKLQITSVNLMTQRNHFFKSWDPKDANENLCTVVMRSFAAPLYFGTLVDKKNQAVWFDGGMGYSNLPLDQARIEARDLLQYGTDIEFHGYGCGFANQDISFKKAAKYKTLRQISRYFDLGDGGLAKAQSRAEQVNKMAVIAKHVKGIGFKYWDTIIPKKIDKLDGVKYLSEYKSVGLEMRKRPMLDIKTEEPF